MNGQMGNNVIFIAENGDTIPDNRNFVGKNTSMTDDQWMHYFDYFNDRQCVIPNGGGGLFKARIGKNPSEPTKLNWFPVGDFQDRLNQLMSMKSSDVPLLARKYATKLSIGFGCCGEVLCMAYAAYAQVVEGYTCTDLGYAATEEAYEFFSRRMKGKV